MITAGPMREEVEDQVFSVAVSQAPALQGDYSIDGAGLASFERVGSRSGELVVDALGLVVAACATALLVTTGSASGAHGALRVFADTLLRLVVGIPVLAAAVGPSRSQSFLRRGFADEVHALAPSVCAGGLVLLALWRLVAAIGASPPSLDAVLVVCALSITAVAAARVGRDRPRKWGMGRLDRVLVVGSGEVADRVARHIAETPHVEIVGFVDDDPVTAARCLGPLGHLVKICERESVTHVVVAFSRSKPQDIIEALRPIQGSVPITVVPRLFEMLPVSSKMNEIGGGLAAVCVGPSSSGRLSRGVKRAIDVSGAAFGLLVLLPLFVLVALGIRLTSKGPVFFRQSRVGRGGSQFDMLKFRTMVVCDSSKRPCRRDGELVVGPFPKLKNDPRVTAFGRFLRRTSIDELPQLWNVLRGEMALVGPRPFMVEDASVIAGWALRRYSVRPGMTGLWQVSGRNELSYADMCRLDQLYVNCWSLGLDVAILLRTVRAVFGGDGAY
jgi:exopolysaccharide biosynthesis polyprenyl glycosylphosphotransferase